VPLPHTRLVHPAFVNHHRQTVAATFGATVKVSRPDLVGTRNATTGKTTFAEPALIYEGPARVQARNRATAPVPVADRIVTVGAYLLVLPDDAPAALLRDLVDVVEVPHAPVLEGSRLHIVDSPQADVAWQRNYGCDLYQPTAKGG
jgi:hypothetical protein